MTEKIIRELEDGLIIRHAAPKDEEALVAFNNAIHSEGEWDKKGLEAWTRDLISGEGPTFNAGDFTIVEDTNSHEIVSSCCTISQTWSYEGIPFKVGRPELVGTKKEYRRKGLIRQQFEILHEWSADRGELVQVITGIPYYYRQFDYEMTLNLGGGRAGYELHVPELKEGEEEPFSFRLAQEADIPFLKAAYDLGCKRSMISALWDEELWRYELGGKRKLNINRREFYVIQDKDGDPVGYISIPPIKWGKNMVIESFEITPGQSWSAVTPSVIRFLWKTGLRLAEEQGQEQKMFGFWLGEEHPAYQVVETALPRVRKPYTFYVRVPDLVAFLEVIKPILEERLIETPFANYTGLVKFSFYRDGLALDFENGRIKSIKNLAHDALDDCAATFVPLTILHLVFGYRTMDELDHAFTDCYTKDDEMRNLVNTLFPRKPSLIWPVS
jgi:hypothetical protein